MSAKSWKRLLLTVWDVLFVMVLCFAILLTTMLVSHSSDQTGFTGYTVDPILLACVVLSTTLYLVFMLHASLKGLRQIVDNYFRGGNSSEETEDKS